MTFIRPVAFMVGAAVVGYLIGVWPVLGFVTGLIAFALLVRYRRHETNGRRHWRGPY